MSAAAIAEPAAAEGSAPVKGGRKKLILIGAIVLVVLSLIGGGTAVFLKKRAAHAAVAAAEAGEEAPAEVEHALAKPDPKHPPTYLPLDPFVINLADKESDRYAQIGITLELEDAATADQMKVYMPAIRNGILMIIAHKTSHDLLDRPGKEELAEEIMREAVRPLGIDIPAPEPVTAARVVAPAITTAIVPVVAAVAVVAAPASAASGSASASAPASVAVNASGSASASASASAPAVAATHTGASAAAMASASAPDEVASRPKRARRMVEATKNPILHVHFSSFIIQ